MNLTSAAIPIMAAMISFLVRGNTGNSGTGLWLRRLLVRRTRHAMIESKQSMRRLQLNVKTHSCALHACLCGDHVDRVGLGIMFDSFNNDGTGKSPLISAVYNNVTEIRLLHRRRFAGSGHLLLRLPQQREPGVRQDRLPEPEAAVSVALYRDAAGQPVFANCFEVEKLDLGVDKFFVLSAHTGDVADNHDIYSVLLRDLTVENSDIDAVRQQFESRWRESRLSRSARR